MIREWTIFDIEEKAVEEIKRQAQLHELPVGQYLTHVFLDEDDMK